MDPCAFCEIFAGDKDAHVLYEDERTAAFLDENPACRGHTLVVPKCHQEHLFAEDQSVAAAVFRTVRTVSLAVRQSLPSDGVSLFYTSAELVGTVRHAHVHVVPRYEDDEIHIALPRESIPDDESARLAGRIREQC